MIVVNLIGGLGNQMFQYAAAKALALEKNQKLYLNSCNFESYKLHKYGLPHFKLEGYDYKEPSKIKRKLIKLFRNRIVFEEQEFNYNPLFHNLKGNPIYLKGYFQSEKYFIKYEKQIRADFEISSLLKDKTQATIDFMKEVNSVSIHMRRGDYLLHEKHNTDKEQYYKKAMNEIERKVHSPVYFLFSDDINWVKENFNSDCETHFIDFNDAESNYEDLKLMASCKHNIIANSSFSWWGAWLNVNPNKMVIAPQKWFNDEVLNYKDIVPENWIKL
jgi:hypothetical protein